MLLNSPSLSGNIAPVKIAGGNLPNISVAPDRGNHQIHDASTSIFGLVLYGFRSPNWQLDAVYEKYNIEKIKENRPAKKGNSDSWVGLKKRLHQRTLFDPKGQTSITPDIIGGGKKPHKAPTPKGLNIRASTVYQTQSHAQRESL